MMIGAPKLMMLLMLLMMMMIRTIIKISEPIIAQNATAMLSIITITLKLTITQTLVTILMIATISIIAKNGA